MQTYEDWYSQVNWWCLKIAKIPLHLLPFDYSGFYDQKYTAKTTALAALVNDFGLTRLAMSLNRKELNGCDIAELVYSANLPGVDSESDIDPYIRKASIYGQ